ncbi:MAG: hypothetical protein NTY07_09350 [Bacteroidia bacterium]|nr:hypothetical protein [Bacteroidia bacterium]
MSEIWSFISDDSLSLVDKTASFLMGEFCSSDVDPIWSAEYFHWKLGPVNPAGRGYISLAIADNRVVGTVSITRKRLIIDGNECIGGELGDGYSSVVMRQIGRPENLSQYDTNPNSYINKSIFGRLASETRARAEADGISIIYGTPNKNSFPRLTQRLGYFDSKTCNIKSFVHPTYRGITLIYPKTHSLKSTLKIIEACSVVFLRNLNKIWCGRNCTIEAEAPSPVELDELWARLKPVSGFALIRDAKYWCHRYQEHPLAKYVFFAVRESGKLCGIVVTRLYTALNGRRHLAILEWMTEEQVSFSRVIIEILYFFRNAEIDLFHCYANTSTKDASELMKSLFISRSRIPFIFADTPMARSLQSNCRQFDFHLGSTDAV